jgi:hypothetical protein
MSPEIQEMPFDALRTLHREIAALIAQKRHEAVEEIKGRIELLGLTQEDFAPPKKKRGRKARQQQEEAPHPDNDE